MSDASSNAPTPPKFFVYFSKSIKDAGMIDRY